MEDFLMKKGFLSFITILCTILCCTYMLTYKAPSRPDYRSDKSGYKTPYNSNIEAEEKTEKKTENGSDKNLKTENSENTEKSEDSEQNNEPKIEYPVTEEVKSVFKVSKDSISISSKEKLKLLLIYKKLDKEDQDRITEYLNGQDEDSVKSIFHILRDRLNDDDYKSVRNIASRFINLDVAEN